MERTRMAASIWPTIHAERQALADDLAELAPQQWQTPSLCSEWTVHDVLAHMLATATMTPPRFLVRMAAAGFRFHTFTAADVAAHGAHGPAATLAAFRAAVGRESAPPGPKDTWLGEAFVHAEDIRRPLGISRRYPLAEVARALAFYTRSNTIVGGRDRVAGLTLRATDTDFSAGSGPHVEGPAVSLMLAATGRAAALDQLSGPGVDVLRQRR
jgi:uncharacterized protein (TIGR03083 family)